MSGIVEFGRSLMQGLVGNDRPAGLTGCTAAGLEDSCVASNYAPQYDYYNPNASPATDYPYTDPNREPATWRIFGIANCDGSINDITVESNFGEVHLEEAEDGTLTAIVSYRFEDNVSDNPERITVTITGKHGESLPDLYLYPPSPAPVDPDAGPYDVCEEYPSPEILATGISTSPHYSEAQINEEMLFSIPLNLVEACDDTTAADYADNPLANPFQGIFIIENEARIANIDYETGSGVFHTPYTFLEQGNQTVRFYVIDTSRPEAGHSNIINLNDFWVSDPAGVDQPPAAIVAPFAGEVDELIEFISPSADELLYSYNWNFVDSSPIESGASVFHAFSNPGTYQVQLRVASLSNPDVYSLVTQNVTIVPPGVDIPALSMILQDAAEEDTLVMMSVDNPDLANFTYSWNFGKGGPITPGTDVSASYAEPGTYTVILYAESISNPGTVFAVSRLLTVVGHGNPVPNLELSPASMGPVPLTVNFDATGSYATAGNLNPEDIASYTFDFGDDTPVVINGTGTTSHQYNDIGAFTVVLTVEDTNGQTSTITTTVNTWGS